VRARGIVAHVPRTGQSALIISRAQLADAALRWEPSSQQWYLEMSHQSESAKQRMPARSTLSGDDAVRAARLVLPIINSEGAGKYIVQDAVRYLEDVASTTLLFAQVAQTLPALEHNGRRLGARAQPLNRLPIAARLALEMATNEETERRALDGELHLLEGAWSRAEEIAAIADDMFLPPAVDEHLARLKRDP
jgi:hypothetical protein